MMNHVKKMALQLTLMGVVLLCIGVMGVTQAKAAIEPGHEIKYNIKSELFNEANILSTFSATKKDEVKIYYFDTPSKNFQTADYNNRLRVYKGSNKIDITYKKRFLNTPLEEALAITESHGFTGSESNYKFELDIKGGNRTFTISRKESLKATSKVSYDTVDTSAAKKLILDNVPKKILNWDSAAWYNDTLAQAVVYGPATATTYKGSYAGYEADIEVWNYQGEIMVELSTKESDAAKAASIEQQWQDHLLTAGYLSADQRGKTAFVMDK
ncbi:CYTH domain-containing protein [Lysinibacillus parviboronicapiens]|uniref:CYTH domain-containing protein n=2 Tax=Lysinibacillus parviboronicapiens TaxID=436516 RepID=UPI001FD06433|nr:CYTH domain-containing protein [Lysinibacillus parviboronicapiens]